MTEFITFVANAIGNDDVASVDDDAIHSSTTPDISTH